MEKQVETPDRNAILDGMTTEQLLDMRDCLQQEISRINKEIAQRLMSRKQSK